MHVSIHIKKLYFGLISEDLGKDAVVGMATTDHIVAPRLFASLLT